MVAREQREGGSEREIFVERTGQEGGLCQSQTWLPQRQRQPPQRHPTLTQRCRLEQHEDLLCDVHLVG
jgi:hypothetical protein